MLHCGGEARNAAQAPGDRKARLWVACHVVRFCCFARFRYASELKQLDLQVCQQSGAAVCVLLCGCEHISREVPETFGSGGHGEREGCRRGGPVHD